MLVSAMTVMNTAGPRNTAPVEAWMAVMISGVTPPTVAPVLQQQQHQCQSQCNSLHLMNITQQLQLAAAARSPKLCPRLNPLMRTPAG
jgi:hypothetical protein